MKLITTVFLSILMATSVLLCGCQSRQSNEQVNVLLIQRVLNMQEKGQISNAEAIKMMQLILNKNTAPAQQRSQQVQAEPQPQQPVKKQVKPVQQPVQRQFITKQSSQQQDNSLPGFNAYQPTTNIRGRLRSLGSDTMDKVMELWQQQFRRFYPRVMTSHEGKGSSTAPPALIEGRSELGPMSRAIKSKEVTRFEKKFGYKPTQFPVAVDALAVYVHPDNPIAKKGLSLEELDAIYSLTRKRKHPANIRTWGQLGLTGEWQNAPIKLIGRNSASGTNSLFKKLVLKKGKYKDNIQAKVGSAELVKSIANDKYAIGYSGIGYKTNDVAVVPLSKKIEGQKFPPESTYAYSKEYPLARFLYVTINNKPGNSPKPIIKEFIKLIYSSQGQSIVKKDGFFSIDSETAKKELSKMNIN